MSNRQTGTVKWFNDEGFGFITHNKLTSGYR